MLHPQLDNRSFQKHNYSNTNPNTYLLGDYKEILKGAFYESEIQNKKHPDTFLIKKILLQQKGKKALVKGLGFASKHNSSLPINEIKIIKNF